MNQTQKELKHIASADARLSPMFKDRVLDTRSTLRNWGWEEADSLLKLIATAHRQYQKDQTTEIFTYDKPINQELVELYATTHVRLYDGEQLHSGCLLTQATHTFKGISPLLKFKLLNAPLLFSLLSDEALAAIRKICAKETSDEQQALADLVPFMMGAPFDASRWLEHHWVTVRNALAARSK